VSVDRRGTLAALGLSIRGVHSDTTKLFRVVRGGGQLTPLSILMYHPLAMPAFRVALVSLYLAFLWIELSTKKCGKQ